MGRRRKILAVIAATLLLAAALCLLVAKPWQPRVDPSTVADVTVFLPGLSWYLAINPDGSASLQYGSGPGDSGRVGPGTVDFAQVVSEAARARASSSKRGATQVS